MGDALSSLEGRYHTFVTDCDNKHLRSVDIPCAAPGAAPRLATEQFPPDLQAVIRRWDYLPEALQTAIAQVVKTVKISGRY